MKLETTNTWGLIPVNKIIILTALLFSFFATELASAQEGKAFQSKSKTVKLNFEDELIKGKNARPEVEYIFEKSQFNFKKLIRLRDNFIPEAGKGREEFSEK